MSKETKSNYNEVEASVKLLQYTDQIQQQTTIFKIDLSEYPIGDEGAIALADAFLTYGQSPVELHLRHCGIGIEGTNMLNIALESSKNLNVVDLSGNKIAAAVLEELPFIKNAKKNKTNQEASRRAAASTFTDTSLPLSLAEVAAQEAAEIAAEQKKEQNPKSSPLSPVSENNENAQSPYSQAATLVLVGAGAPPLTRTEPVTPPTTPTSKAKPPAPPKTMQRRKPVLHPPAIQIPPKAEGKDSTHYNSSDSENDGAPADRGNVHHQARRAVFFDSDGSDSGDDWITPRLQRYEPQQANLEESLTKDEMKMITEGILLEEQRQAKVAEEARKKANLRPIAQENKHGIPPRLADNDLAEIEDLPDYSQRPTTPKANENNPMLWMGLAPKGQIAGKTPSSVSSSNTINYGSSSGVYSSGTTTVTSTTPAVSTTSENVADAAEQNRTSPQSNPKAPTAEAALKDLVQSQERG